MTETPEELRRQRDNAEREIARLLSEKGRLVAALEAKRAEYLAHSEHSPNEEYGYDSIVAELDVFLALAPVSRAATDSQDALILELRRALGGLLKAAKSEGLPDIMAEVSDAREALGMTPEEAIRQFREQVLLAAQ